MSELLGNAINFLSEMLSGMVSNGELSSYQAIFIIFFYDTTTSCHLESQRNNYLFKRYEKFKIR
ncbi:hypothetical protein [Providencia rettgeri]|uniref:hypothetical protein n=1 Tax=Providencia rettgeri TaxID=587 RepID=UPI0023625042|nr:hypothetical protein [Providencia rettgeri]